MEKQQRELRGARRLATGFLVAAAILFVVSKWFEGRFPLAEWVRAFSEAAMVGALADWFAVVALFRHPLGIPIPHTAIIAERKDMMGKSLGLFIQKHFFARKVVLNKLRELGVAGIFLRWLSQPASGRIVVKHMVPAIAEMIRSEELRGKDSVAAHVAGEFVNQLRMAPTAGKILDAVLKGGLQNRVLDKGLRVGEEILIRREGDLQAWVNSNAPWFLPKFVRANLALKVHASLLNVMRSVRAEPEHPLRGELREYLLRLRSELAESIEMRDKFDRLKDDLLHDAGWQQLGSDLWGRTHGFLVEQSENPQSVGRLALERALSRMATEALEDEIFMQRCNRVVELAAMQLLGAYKHEIGSLISWTIEKWDPKVAVERLELLVGRDLQYIRINGTVIGGLVGLLIHSMSKWIEWMR